MTADLRSADRRGVTSTEAVAGAIRAHIISGRYEAGQRLVEADVAVQLGVSRTSVREALRVLASQGFAAVKPYFGTFVATMTAKEAQDLLELQGALEATAAGLAAARRSTEQLVELHTIVESGRWAANDGGSEELHGRFHAVLGEASGNDSLAQLISTLRYKIEWVYSATVIRPPGDSWAEHANILDAIERRDIDEAVLAARTHTRRATVALRRTKQRTTDAASRP